MVPSGIAPQLTATYGPCFRALNWWTMRGMDSFPVPLSPSTRTLMSVVATCAATDNARSSAGAFPTTPNLRLIAPTSMLSYPRVRR